MRLMRGASQLVLIGAPAERGGHLRRLKRLAGLGGMDGRVRFAGSVDRASVVAYLNAADASVLPSRSEGCPNVVLESLACGTPVVATSVGAVPDLVRPGTTGLIVPPGRPEALASALAEALHRPWSREAIRSSVERRTWQVVAGEVLEVFRRAAGG